MSWPALGAAPSRPPDLIGIALQGPSLLPPLDVTENLMLPLLLSGVPDKIARRQAASLLATFDLSAAASTLPEELSGGQASRVGLVRALVARPRLILADEPTGQLDTATAANVMALLADAATACGAALVVPTHDPAVAARLPLRWRLDDGVLHTAGLVRLHQPSWFRGGRRGGRQRPHTPPPSRSQDSDLEASRHADHPVKDRKSAAWSREV